MQRAIIYYDNVKKLLEEEGYQLGFEAISNEIPSTCVASYWFLESDVRMIKHKAGVVTGYVVCNTGKAIEFYNCDTMSLMSNIAMATKQPYEEPAGILNTFKNVVFKDYDQNVEKYDKIMQAIPKFKPKFLQLFQEEIDQMTSSETSVVVSIAENSWFRRGDQIDSAYYVSGVVDNTVILTDLFDEPSRDSMLDARELMNDYEAIELPEFVRKLLLDLVCGFHEVFNPGDLVPILAQLGCSNLEAIEQLYLPIQSDRHVDLKFEGDMFSNHVYFSGSSYVNLKLSFTYISLTTDNFQRFDHAKNVRPVQSIKEAIKPYSFLRCAIELVNDTLVNFHPVFVTMPELQAYLIKLLIALEGVEPIEIKYEAEWKDFDTAAVEEKAEKRSSRLLGKIRLNMFDEE